MNTKILLITVLLFGSIPAMANTGQAKKISADIPAGAVSGLALHARVGEATISTSTDDTVHVALKLEPKQHSALWLFHWYSEKSIKAVRKATLEQHVDGGVLQLAAKLPKDVDKDGIKEHWIISLPARFAVQVAMNVGELKITGPAGGVKAKLNVGEMKIDVPSGAIKANINVGEIRAVNATRSYGQINLSSNVGDASVTMTGVGNKEEGQRSGLGRNLTIAGNGPDTIDMGVNVGEVTLKLTGKQTPTDK